MGRIYLSMGSLMLAGIANMLFTKTKLYRKYRYPIDANRNARDGRRIFGPNKTWIGFCSMVVFSILFQLLCGLLCSVFSLEAYHDLYRCAGNSLGLNVVFGALIGAAYMLCELPNSFIKRRLGISSGEHGRGWIGILFFILDQIDSLLGVMLVLVLYTDIGAVGYVQYLAVGAFTHIGVNLLLRTLKVRKNL